MIDVESDTNYARMEDRNGHLLEYGDKVLAKIWVSQSVTICTVVAFSKNMVLVIPDGNMTTCAWRKSSNLIWVKDIYKWKLNF